MNDLKITISDSLKEWLAKREKVLKVQRRIYEDGGHLMLKTTSYDPNSLDEPLKSEALVYFRSLDVSNE